jgi:hypothetical protein
VTCHQDRHVRGSVPFGKGPEGAPGHRVVHGDHGRDATGRPCVEERPHAFRKLLASALVDEPEVVLCRYQGEVGGGGRRREPRRDFDFPECITYALVDQVLKRSCEGFVGVSVADSTRGEISRQDGLELELQLVIRGVQGHAEKSRFSREMLLTHADPSWLLDTRSPRGQAPAGVPKHRKPMDSCFRRNDG